MVTITFADRVTEKRALGFLLGRFSGRVLRSGEHLVPEAALEERLADQGIPFMVKGKATYEQTVGGGSRCCFPFGSMTGAMFRRNGSPRPSLRWSSSSGRPATRRRGLRGTGPMVASHIAMILFALY